MRRPVIFSSHEAGFTLIELLLVISILTLLSAMSAPFYSRFINQNAVENATQQFLGDFRKAQIYAMTGKQNGNWGVHYASNTITLYQGVSFGTNPALNETFSVPGGTAISGFTDINFAKVTGIPASGNPSTTPVIVISAPGNNSSTITINSQGVATR